MMLASDPAPVWPYLAGGAVIVLFAVAAAISVAWAITSVRNGKNGACRGAAPKT